MKRLWWLKSRLWRDVVAHLHVVSPLCQPIWIQRRENTTQAVIADAAPAALQIAPHRNLPREFKPDLRREPAKNSKLGERGVFWEILSMISPFVG